jgi:hypothetical protein
MLPERPSPWNDQAARSQHVREVVEAAVEVVRCDTGPEFYFSIGIVMLRHARLAFAREFGTLCEED